jgi:hypothetical protein
MQYESEGEKRNAHVMDDYVDVHIGQPGAGSYRLSASKVSPQLLLPIGLVI